jgi:lipase chaperone LimK
MTAAEILKSLHSALGETVEHFDAIDAAEEKVRKTRLMLAQIMREGKMVMGRLEAVKAELARTEANRQSGHHLVIGDEAARRLQELDRQIAAKERELEELRSR